VDLVLFATDISFNSNQIILGIATKSAWLKKAQGGFVFILLVIIQQPVSGRRPRKQRRSNSAALLLYLLRECYLLRIKPISFLNGY
jgi:hypothetical protein